MNADAVIEGGGVKGIGLVGAIFEAEKKGYSWQRLAGTSAGAIIASLLAAGYSAAELKNIILTLDYKRFVEKKGLQRIPVTGDIIYLWKYLGVHSSTYIEEWLEDLLIRKGIRTFGDLNKKLNIIASDITSGQMLVLPDDIVNFGIIPDSLSVARAVRMSISIPYFFQPVKLVVSTLSKKKDHYIVDGGMLSNFPVWLFDRRENPRWPTFGFRLVSEKTGQPNQVNGPLTLTRALINTMLEAHDTRHIKEQDYVRTILVPTLGVKTTDFHITREQSEALFMSGARAGERFFEKWNFHRYVAAYRATKKLV